jgi:Protein of unknown function (DUF3891)
MIVVYKESGWVITTQRSHGILAAQVAMHWKNAPFHDRWLETILATAEHDDAENELDGENLLTENGGPLDYKMKKFDLGHCQKLVIHAATKSQYIYLLTSLHMEFLYRDEAKKNKQASHFLNAERKKRTAICKKLSLTPKKAREIYSLFEWCDAFSLLLCQHAIPPENRKLEISTGPDGKPYLLSRLKDNQLLVEPWPFDTASFEVHFESRTIRKIKFESSAELRAEFIKTPVEEIKYHVCKKHA